MFTMSSSSVQEADQQQKKNLLQERQENPPIFFYILPAPTDLLKMQVKFHRLLWVYLSWPHLQQKFGIISY